MRRSLWLKKMKSHMTWLYWFMVIFAIYLVGTLYKVQIADAKRYQEIAEFQHHGQLEIPALRGKILDRNRSVLAKSVERESLAVDPSKVEDPVGLSIKLAPILKRDPQKLLETLKAPGSFAWLERKMSDEAVAKIRDLEESSLFFLSEPSPGKRYYPKGSLAAHLLGATGIDDQGLEGLEASYDEILAGEPGLIQAFFDRDGWAMTQGQALVKDSYVGKDLVLTIDETIQYIAERELKKTVKQYGAEGGVVMVMGAKTGEILALALEPGFEAEKFMETPLEVRRNRAVTDPYEPGSTFKIFLVAAALEEGVLPEDTFRSGGMMKLGGWPIHNASDGLVANALEPVSNILAYSFNIGTASIAMHIGKEKFAQSLEEFGFGLRTGIDLDGESVGIVPDVKDWADIHLATISFGQGVSATPVQLVSAMQAVANDGVRMKPHLVKEILDSSGRVVEQKLPQELGRVMKKETARQLREMLALVVEKGTGKRAAVKGYRVGGKTGTAQIPENGRYAPGKYVASFLGVAPVEDPEVVILVKIDKPTPYWGGLVAGPVFSKVAEKALWRMKSVEPKDLKNEKKKEVSRRADND